MKQTWTDLLFAHWPVQVGPLRRLVPDCLPLDLYQGQAYVAVVPFGMSHVHPRYTVSVPWLSNFLELNVRTYVTLNGRPGVYFFSLDAANPVAVAIARRWYRLPYFNARMSLTRSDNDWIEYRSTRTHAGAPSATLAVRYRPCDPVRLAVPGSREAFLTERYCLYTVDAAGRPYRGEIHHVPWPLQLAEAEFAENTMALAAGLDVHGPPPLLHFARRLDILAWSIQPCDRETD
jgi:hypothetical protein